MGYTPESFFLRISLSFPLSSLAGKKLFFREGIVVGGVYERAKVSPRRSVGRRRMEPRSPLRWKGGAFQEKERERENREAIKKGGEGRPRATVGAREPRRESKKEGELRQESKSRRLWDRVSEVWKETKQTHVDLKKFQEEEA